MRVQKSGAFLVSVFDVEALTWGPTKVVPAADVHSAVVADTAAAAGQPAVSAAAPVAAAASTSAAPVEKPKKPTKAASRTGGFNKGAMDCHGVRCSKTEGLKGFNSDTLKYDKPTRARLWPGGLPVANPGKHKALSNAWLLRDSAAAAWAPTAQELNVASGRDWWQTEQLKYDTERAPPACPATSNTGAPKALREAVAEFNAVPREPQQTVHSGQLWRTIVQKLGRLTLGGTPEGVGSKEYVTAAATEGTRLKAVLAARVPAAKSAYAIWQVALKDSGVKVSMKQKSQMWRRMQEDKKMFRAFQKLAAADKRRYEAAMDE